MNKIYLDYASGTPVDRRVFEAMQPYFLEFFGNPGSLHSFGQAAIAAVDKSRETIAHAIAAQFSDVVFTGSATEANNLALRGVVRAAARTSKPIRVIVSAIEHESVLETARALENDGVEVIYLPVDKDGFVHLEKLKAALNERTVLVSLMFVNNEIGTIQPIAEISKIIKDFNHEILFHTDAVQAFQFLDCNVNSLGVDLMTLSAHKIYGPKGIGVLYIRNLEPKTSNLAPIITGGGQEWGLRSGTENVPNIVGFAKAVELVSNSRESANKEISNLRDYFWQGLKKIYPACERNGGEPTLSNILNVYFPDHLAEDLLIKFDLVGIAVSAGSACRARSVEPSYVIKALGLGEERARRSIRFSFGRFTTKEELEEALEPFTKAFLNTH